MATLRDRRTGRSWLLESECLIGRSPACAIRLDDSFVSSQHASVRWTGEAWEVRDLGSLNGTRVDDATLAAGQTQALHRGARAGFGSAETHWELVDDAPPAVMAVEVGGARATMIEDEIVGIPSDAPVASIFRGPAGRWQLERADGSSVEISDGQTFELEGRPWRFSCPHVVAPTQTSAPRPYLASAALTFRVSRDEEYIELTADLAGHPNDLGSRAHNPLLLMLARHLLADRANGLPESLCGWVYADDLAGELGSTVAQINIDIFRARRQFGALGLADPSGVVQRRPRTGQMRLGVSQVSITPL
jgi:hypothetical protein